jgi:photosystem II stability/assembly factor-like uncharacterized protein
MYKFTIYLLFAIFIAGLLPGNGFKTLYAQNNNSGILENESSEEILAREQFILMRRAGGPGKVLPPNAYEDAIRQKSLMPRDNTTTVNWVSVNPIGLFYSWTGNNYISGRTNSIAFHPTDPNTIYIAAAQGGVWKTVDGGVTWVSLTDNLATLACGDIAVDQSNPNVLYLGTGELNYSLDSQYGNGIFKSTDAGTTWVQIAAPSLVGTRCSQISIDPTNSNIVYMSGSFGVMKSTDAGLSWVNTSSGTNANCVFIEPTNTQVLYATTGGYSSGSVKKSTDGGTTWNTLAGGLPTGMGRVQLAPAASDHNTIYASIAQPGGALLGLYRTTDAGATWTLQASSPNYLSGQGWYDNAVTVNPSNANLVIVGGLDAYSSSTGGSGLVQKSSWSTNNSANMTHADIHRLLYRGSVLYCCSDGGVYKSTNDGTSWVDLNHTISTLQYESADYDATNTNNLQGGCQDNNKETSTDGGNNWNQRATGDGGYTVIDPVTPNYAYGQYVQGSIQRSANSGFGFTNITPSGSTGGLFYDPYEMAPGDHNTIVFGRADVWETNSAQTCSTGSGWTQIATTAVVGGNVSAVGISWTNTNKIYIGTSNGRILVTADGGTTWQTITGYPYVSDLIVDNTDDNVCYATCTGASATHVLKTTDGGATWTNITNNLPNIAANSIILRTPAPRMLFVGTDLGVFQSTDDGGTWVSFNSGLPSVQVYDLKYKQGNGIILAATHGRGCYTFNLAAIIGIETDPFGQIPKDYKLNQNFPNPFNPSTNIRFGLPKSSIVKITVYNILGKEIATLVNSRLNGGTFEVHWDASNYSSGVYFYKLQADSYSETKRMLLVK